MGTTPALACVRSARNRKSHCGEPVVTFTCPALSSHVAGIHPRRSGQPFLCRRSTASPAVPPCPASLPATPARLHLPWGTPSCGRSMQTQTRHRALNPSWVCCGSPVPGACSPAVRATAQVWQGSHSPYRFSSLPPPHERAPCSGDRAACPQRGRVPPEQQPGARTRNWRRGGKPGQRRAGHASLVSTARLTAGALSAGR